MRIISIIATACLYACGFSCHDASSASLANFSAGRSLSVRCPSVAFSTYVSRKMGRSRSVEKIPSNQTHRYAFEVSSSQVVTFLGMARSPFVLDHISYVPPSNVRLGDLSPLQMVFSVQCMALSSIIGRCRVSLGPKHLALRRIKHSCKMCAFVCRWPRRYP